MSEASGEAFYLRDEDSGRVWSPQPLPCRGEGRYRTRHGFGYSVYEHEQDGIASELWVYVALHDAVKFSVVKLRNLSGRTRRISATGYVEWILGDLRAKSQMHIVSEQDGPGGALLARNPYSAEFSGCTAFFDADACSPADGARSFSGDRAEFLGRNGDLASPLALRREKLSGRVGAGLDPCAAIQVSLTLAGGASSQTVFRLGAGKDRDDALHLARRLRGDDVVGAHGDVLHAGRAGAVHRRATAAAPADARPRRSGSRRRRSPRRCPHHTGG